MKKMQLAKFAEIKKQLKIEDDNLYFYTTEADGTLKLRQASEYEILAEEGLKEVYDEEPEGLWEKCLED
jgi:uncharacterized phage-like protein YoqJ